MKAEIHIDIRQVIAEQAAHWLLTLQSEEATATQHAEYVEWLRQSPLHVAEMLRICLLQRDLSSFKGWDEIEPLVDDRSSAVLQFSAARADSPQPKPWGVTKPLWMAAAVVLFCITGVLVFVRLGQEDFRTQLGEKREVTLADGSVVDLAPASEVVVRYRPQERLIELKNGQALFRVAKNPSRPFIVQAATTKVVAVGTVFNVDRDEQGAAVTVTVVEGRVAVKARAALRLGRHSAETTEPLSLVENEQVHINAAGTAGAVHRVKSATEVAWTKDQVRFENETVAEVVRRFNHYNRTKIDVIDPQLAERRISGVLQISDPDAFVAFIQMGGDVQVSRPDSTHIILGSINGNNGNATQ